MMVAPVCVSQNELKTVFEDEKDKQTGHFEYFNNLNWLFVEMVIFNLPATLIELLPLAKCSGATDMKWSNYC
jgi:hypothetical protein